MDEDFIVDNIVSHKPKRIKSGKKGKRVELNLVKAFNERFSKLFLLNPDWGQFSRTIGSGNRWGQQVKLPKHAKDTFTGDLVCPENFVFVIESKGGYNDIDLCSAFDGKCKGLDNFLDQVTSDSKRSGKKPLLVWKKDRKPSLAFVITEELPRTFKCSMRYNEWTAISLKDLLALDDGFFFSK